MIDDAIRVCRGTVDLTREGINLFERWNQAINLIYLIVLKTCASKGMSTIMALKFTLDTASFTPLIHRKVDLQSYC